MDTETPVQTQEQPRRLEEDWAEAEWFQIWLRLARREYQGHPDAREEFRQAA